MYRTFLTYKMFETSTYFPFCFRCATCTSVESWIHALWSALPPFDGLSISADVVCVTGIGSWLCVVFMNVSRVPRLTAAESSLFVSSSADSFRSLKINSVAFSFFFKSRIKICLGRESWPEVCFYVWVFTFIVRKTLWKKSSCVVVKQ